jgi:hypothetical protein
MLFKNPRFQINIFFEGYAFLQKNKKQHVIAGNGVFFYGVLLIARF